MNHAEMKYRNPSGKKVAGDVAFLVQTVISRDRPRPLLPTRIIDL